MHSDGAGVSYWQDGTDGNDIGVSDAEATWSAENSQQHQPEEVEALYATAQGSILTDVASSLPQRQQQLQSAGIDKSPVDEGSCPEVASSPPATTAAPTTTTGGGGDRAVVGIASRSKRTSVKLGRLYSGSSSGDGSGSDNSTGASLGSPAQGFAATTTESLPTKTSGVDEGNASAATAAEAVDT